MYKTPLIRQSSSSSLHSWRSPIWQGVGEERKKENIEEAAKDLKRLCSGLEKRVRCQLNPALSTAPWVGRGKHGSQEGSVSARCPGPDACRHGCSPRWTPRESHQHPRARFRPRLEALARKTTENRKGLHYWTGKKKIP